MVKRGRSPFRSSQKTSRSSSSGSSISKRSRTSARSSSSSGYRSSRSSSGRSRSTVRFAPITGKIVRSRYGSGKLNKKIQNVINKNHNMGIYHRFSTGQLRLNTIFGAVDYFYGFSYLNNVATGDTYDNAFIPFQPVKVMDAASVLFNSKAKDWKGPTTFVGNMSSSDTNVMLCYASYEVDIKNITDFELSFTLFEYKNKSNTDVPFIDDFSASITAEPWAGGGPTLIPGTNQIGWTLDRGVELGQASSLPMKYTLVKKYTKLVKPGAHFKMNYSIRDKEYDFAKYLNQTGTFSLYGRGFQQIVLKVEPVIHMRYQLNGTPIDSTANFAVNQTRYRGLPVTVKEVFKILEPENATDTGDRRANLIRIEGDPTGGSGSVESGNVITRSYSAPAPAYQ